MIETIEFLRKLSENNNKEWFTANKKEYDVCRKQLVSFIQQIIDGLAETDADIAGLNASKSVFRINRDIRFSANKQPYKTNMGAYLSKGGKQLNYAGYYLHLQPGECFLGGGIYMPESKVLQAIRQEIHFNHAALSAILESKKFKKYFTGLDPHTLKTSPKGYDKEHEAIDLLRHTSFVSTFRFNENELNKDSFQLTCLEAFRSLSPMIQWINNAIDMTE
jgi:uncharacterized protein (TIGR02453 family)